MDKKAHTLENAPKWHEGSHDFHHHDDLYETHWEKEASYSEKNDKSNPC